MSVEQVIKVIQHINDRPAKIVESAYENVYKRKSEWYGLANKELFYASIPDVVYKENSIPLKKEFKEMLTAVYGGSHSVPRGEQRNPLVEDYKGEGQPLSRSASGSTKRNFTANQQIFFKYLKGMLFTITFRKFECKSQPNFKPSWRHF